MKILKISLIGLMVFTLAGFFGNVHLILDLASHFRLQYYLAASFLLIAFILLKSWRWALASLVPIVINGALIFPWFVAHPVVSEKPDLKLLLCNVEADNTHYAGVEKMVREANADLVVLVETNFKWDEALEGAKELYPYHLIRARGDCFGMSVYSRFPLEPEKARFDACGEIYTHVMKVHAGKKDFSLVAVHPPPPVSLERYWTRNREYAEIIREVKKLLGPVIVAGDFNSSMWSVHYRRLVKESGLANARSGFGVLQTWPAFLPDLFRIPLDHCLASPRVRVLEFKTGKRDGSDHLPMIAEIKL